MKNVNLFLGSNKFQIKQEIQKIVKQLNVDELSLAKFDCEEVSINDVLNDCETQPFFIDKKVVIINNPIFLASDKVLMDDDMDRLTNYIQKPNNSTILIIDASNVNVDKRKKLFKDFQQYGNVVIFESVSEDDIVKIIKDFFKNINCNIDFETVNEIVLRTECDISRLYQELDKLSFYCENKNTITIEDVKLLISEPVENNIFNLTNNIIEGNIEKSLQIYYKLLMQNEEPIVFSAILAKNFHNIYLIKQYQQKNVTELQLKNILKIHPFQLKKLFSIALKTKEANLIKNIQLLNAYDIAVKSGKVDKNLGFELFILNIR